MPPPPSRRVAVAIAVTSGSSATRPVRSRRAAAATTRHQQRRPGRRPARPLRRHRPGSGDSGDANRHGGGLGHRQDTRKKNALLPPERLSGASSRHSCDPPNGQRRQRRSPTPVALPPTLPAAVTKPAPSRRCSVHSPHSRARASWCYYSSTAAAPVSVRRRTPPSAAAAAAARPAPPRRSDKVKRGGLEGSKEQSGEAHRAGMADSNCRHPSSPPNAVTPGSKVSRVG